LGVATTFYIKAIRTHTAPDPDLFCELVLTQNAVVNVNNDADGDGISGITDLDDDNDGIPDIVEGKGVNPSLDSDSNGIPNFLDINFAGFIDTNSDGVDDRFDQDLDGIANHLDLDSDNDGIADVIEAGGVDVAGNGIVDFTQADANTADADNDGLIDNIDQNPAAISADAAASSELTNGSYGGKYVSGSALDTDADGIPDFLDLDSDNDGIMDVLEAGGIDANNNGIIDFTGTFASNDSNSNGWINTKDGASGGTSPITTTGTAGSAPTGYLGQNADGDSVPNFRDLDSDNDGINDVIEAGLTDSDGNGLIGSGSGTTITGLNTTSGVVTGATSAVLNTDSDSVANYLDLDSDNDGINDVRENGSATLDTNNDGKIDVGDGQTDTDGDGIFTGLDTSVGFGDSSDPAAADADNDGVPNYRDLDADNDGINDVRENGGTDANNDGLVDGTDADNDGILSSADNNAGFGDTSDPAPANADGDSVANYLDLDADNDGINDVRENGGTDANNDGLVDGTDADNDGILSSADNNVGFGDTSDPAPANADGDSVANYLDLDADNDGINDVRENGNGNLDTNNDGKIDSGDGQTDTDNDGVFTGLDNFVGFGDATDPAPANADGDSVANYLDLDADNDGINDVIEGGNASFDTNSDGVIDGPDADLDGIQDGVDANDAGFGEGTNGDATPPLNSDGDSVPNYLDLDSDNDNINDVIENQDTNGNGIIDGGETSLDTNNDGLVDSADNDGDGIQDAADTNDAGFGENIGTSTATATDTDGGASPNYIDTNSDGDGINDIDEACGSAGCSTLDADNDGDVDGSADNDGDGILDSADANDSGFGEGGGPLPVTFVSFEGKLSNNRVQFTWKTAAETNNSHFIIERSLDTRMWAEVSRVNAKGESQNLTVYQGFDENPQVGTNYYRLWQVDKDGKQEAYPRLIDITYQFMAITSVYPNPSIDKLNVKLKSNVNEPVQIRIINASGKVLETIRFQKATLEEEAVLNVKDLPSGTYFLEIFYHKGRETLKFVK
jgi:Secretion system C-terminal sorting domain